MGSKIEAYVDTAAFISVFDKSDSHHSLFRRLFSSPPALITSALAIAEGHGWFLRRYDSAKAIQFLHFIDELPALMIREFDDTELRSVGTLLKKFSDQRLTLADVHGLTVIRQLSIRTCWSTDRHLTLTGAALVI